MARGSKKPARAFRKAVGKSRGKSGAERKRILGTGLAKQSYYLKRHQARKAHRGGLF